MFGLQSDYLSDAMNLASIIENYFGKKVSHVTPKVNSKNQFPWFSVSFLMYRTYLITYEYERGYYSIFSTNQETSGISIQFSVENKRRFKDQNSDESTIIENLKLLDSEVRLRLPDKFLSMFD